MIKNPTNFLDVNWIKMKRRSSKSITNEVKIIEQKSKQLMIILNENILKFDLYELRKKINIALKTIKCNVQIIIINKNVSRKTIVMKIVESNTIDQLIQHRSIWNNIIKPKYVIKDEIWHQFIVNYVHVKRFNKRKTLQNEMKTYNFVKLKFAPRWLWKNNGNKIHFSIVVIVLSNNDVEVIKSDLNIKRIRCKSIKFSLIQSFTQCIKCQKFEHVQIICKNEIKCEICAQKHEINQHICNICKSKNHCTHIILKCANCNESHVIKSQSCGIFLALRAKNAPINVEEEL